MFTTWIVVTNTLQVYINKGSWSEFSLLNGQTSTKRLVCPLNVKWIIQFINNEINYFLWITDNADLTVHFYQDWASDILLCTFIKLNFYFLNSWFILFSKGLNTVMDKALGGMPCFKKKKKTNLYSFSGSTVSGKSLFQVISFSYIMVSSTN